MEQESKVFGLVVELESKHESNNHLAKDQRWSITGTGVKIFPEKKSRIRSLINCLFLSFMQLLNSNNVFAKTGIRVGVKFIGSKILRLRLSCQAWHCRKARHRRQSWWYYIRSVVFDWMSDGFFSFLAKSVAGLR